MFRLAPVLALLLLAATAQASDWPQYRGPSQQGSSPESDVFPAKTFALEPVWKASVDEGYTSVLIAGGLVVTMGSDGKSSHVVALDDKMGDVLWRYRVGDHYPAHTGSDGGPSSTPILADGKLYGIGRFGKLFALDASDGRELWTVELDGQSYTKTPHYGWTTSPIVVDDLLIVMTGGAKGGSISAFERKTGKKRWSAGDGEVQYQSPALLEIDGKSQLVAANDVWILGLDPATGEILWKYEHDTYQVEAFAHPLPIGKNRILINSLQEAVAMEVRRAEGGYDVAELWRSNVLKSSYAVPVYLDGHVYGFNRSMLVAVDAATGGVMWKSREPGGRGLTLVDGHLLVLSPEGEVVVVRAIPEGYEERGRFPALERYSMMPPSFANGNVYVRNLTELASLKVVSGKGTATASVSVAPMLLGSFGERVRQAEASAAAAAAMETFLAEQESFPIIEGDNLVHFVYQGEVESVGLWGTFLTQFSPVEMYRIGETDIFFRSVELDGNAVWEYRFHPDYEARITDPRNPHTVGRTSELRMPGWKHPEHVAEPEGNRGRVDEFDFRSEILGVTKHIQVYVPPGYARSEGRFPIAYMHRGDGALSQGAIDQSLDNLIGSRVRPVILVLLPGPATLEEMGGEASDEIARMIAEELVPHFDRHYRTIADRSARATLGVRDGAILALYTALRFPGVFSNAAAQSGYLQVRIADELLALIAAAPEPRPRVVLQWSQNDMTVEEGSFDAAAGSRRLAEAFQGAGYELETMEVPGSWGWATWRAYYDEILEAFFPSGEGAETTPGP